MATRMCSAVSLVLLVLALKVEGEVTYLTLEESWTKWLAGDFDIVLDARTDGEFDWNGTMLPGWQQLHIPQSVSSAAHTTTINSTDFCKSSKILVHCWAGVAAAALAEQLVSNGFTNVHSLKDGGIADWDVAGYTLTINEGRSPDASLASVQCVGSNRSFSKPDSDIVSEVTYLTLSESWTKWTAGEFDFVLDARTDDDFDANGTMLPGWKTVHIPGAVSSASHKRIINVTDFCKSSKILVHCWGGVAAAALAEELASGGFTDVYSLQGGGIADWQAANYTVTINEARSPEVSMAWAACAWVPDVFPTMDPPQVSLADLSHQVSALAVLLLTAALSHVVESH